MHPALTVILGLMGTVIFLWLVIFRIVRKFRPAPASGRSVPLLAEILENPLRRRLFSPAKLLDRVGIVAGMRVLELGPGPGFLTISAAQRLVDSEGPGTLYCLDIEPAMIARVKNKVTRHNLENVILMLGNGECLPFKDDSFNLIYLVAVLGEIPDKIMALQELYRVLRPGGIFSITEYLLDPDYPLRRTAIAGLAKQDSSPLRNTVISSLTW